MRKHIVCLGDSNTYGFCADPADSADGPAGRYNEQERWTCLLQSALGEDYLVIEEGLPGRTTVFDDPLYGCMSAADYVEPCLRSHGPVSLLIVMLGTNDVKERFGVNGACIALGMERLVRAAQAVDCWANGVPNVLIVSPPPIGPGMEQSVMGPQMGRGCVERSRELATAYAATAELLGVHFLDAKGCDFNRVDHMHLSRRGHAQLAERLRAFVPALI